jgi:hypothetical protein
VLAFVEIDLERPLLAHLGQGQRGLPPVLEKCGFWRSGEGTSTVRGETAEEFVYTLEP